MSRDISLNKVLAGECCVPTCYAEALEDAPFPICMRHMRQVFRYFDGYTEVAKQIFNSQRAIDSARPPKQRPSGSEHDQVYYLRVGEFIKIGYSANIKQRLSQMRLNADAVLATEPGGRDLERLRHQQFTHLRQGRREDFETAADLLSHVAMVREHFGPPRITTWQGAVV